MASSPTPPSQCRHTALTALVGVARHHEVDADSEKLAHDFALEGEPDLKLFVAIAESIGLKAKGASLNWAALLSIDKGYPIVARLKNGNWVVFSGIRREGERAEIAVYDPLSSQAGFLFIDQSALEAAWDGEVVLIKRRYSWMSESQPFGLAWFIPEILRQKRVFGDVALASVVIHVIGFAVPIFMQITIDKVLLHQSLTTLEVIGIGAVAAILFDAFLGYLRGFLLLHASSKIDIRVAAHTFGHLLSLPVTFFEQVAAGVLTKHMQQASTIREFLTGRVVMSGLDAMALLVFLPVLVFYSPTLAAIVIGFSVVLCLVVALVSSLLRKQLNELYRAEGERQGFLVETVHGIGTVKALAIGPSLRKDWDSRSANAIERHLDVGRTSQLGRAVSMLLEKLLMVAIIWIGALEVIDQRLSVGGLVAFNMLAGRVTGPLVQLVTLIQEYQQAALSVRMLGVVMNEKAEGRGGGLQSKLKGGVVFDDVTFRYPGAVRPTLDRVSFSVPAGTSLGIVGRSGSGKTTLTRLIQGLHMVQSGVIRLDENDLRAIDLNALRSQMGVVLQESFLFRGTVRDNIALASPGAPFTAVVNAARLAGAHEFIEQLPDGYDTMLEEGATNLSGGQKQRLSIARAMIRNPALLILDEATSALDPESEAAVRANLKAIASGRTTLIVSHRMPFIVDADAILVMDQGRVADIGPHRDLLARNEIYRHLWRQQMGRQA